jgi:hypothetical protein
MNRTYRIIVAVALACACGRPLAAQQVPDRAFRPAIEKPAYAEGTGPVVCLDEAHHNFHTLDDRFWAFGELMRRDCYVVQANRSRFDGASLARCAILVISNAQPSDIGWNEYPYPTPSAFTPEEVRATHQWVTGGGRLLLIADHMPLGGAAADLAAAFGVTFTDGFAVEGFSDESERDAAIMKPTILRTADQTLRPHAIVRGREPDESVDSVRTFTGQAFQAPSSAEPILVLPATFISLMPEKAWEFGPDTRRVPAGGWLQGAVMRVGSGRAAFFGEAAMFSAQLARAERLPMGMNAPGAEQNFQFALNVVRWLAGSQGPDGQVSSLEARLERLEERIVRSEEATAGAGLVLFVIACLCALWAQNTRRSAWLWFFLGLLFNVITLVVLLRKNSNDLQRDARRADPTGAV